MPGTGNRIFLQGPEKNGLTKALMHPCSWPSGPQLAAGGRLVRRAGRRAGQAARLARIHGGCACSVPGAGAAPRAGHDGAMAGAAS